VGTSRRIKTGPLSVNCYWLMVNGEKDRNGPTTGLQDNGLRNGAQSRKLSVIRYWLTGEQRKLILAVDHTPAELREKVQYIKHVTLLRDLFALQPKDRNERDANSVLRKFADHGSFHDQFVTG